MHVSFYMSLCFLFYRWNLSVWNVNDGLCVMLVEKTFRISLLYDDTTKVHMQKHAPPSSSMFVPLATIAISNDVLNKHSHWEHTTEPAALSSSLVKETSATDSLAYEPAPSTLISATTASAKLPAFYLLSKVPKQLKITAECIALDNLSMVCSSCTSRTGHRYGHTLMLIKCRSTYTVFHPTTDTFTPDRS